MKKLSEIFDIAAGNSLSFSKLARSTVEEGVAFVSRKARDNGVAAYVQPIPSVPANAAGLLTCALNGEGGVLATFLQDRPFYTAYHVACLKPKMRLTTAQLLYYCQCIWANRYRYSWGRQANRSLRDILIPEPREFPAWVRAKSVDSLNLKRLPATPGTVPSLGTASWRPFRLSNLFEIKKGKRLTKANMQPGATPFIAAIDRNNGYRDFISMPPKHQSNTITVNYNGSVAEAFYQARPFNCSDDVNVLYPKFPMTASIGLFIATIIRYEKYRFNFGRKWHLERMSQSEIRLPTKANGTPDWEFMKRLICSLPFSSEIGTAASASRAQ